MDRPFQIELLERRRLHDGHFKLDRYRLRHARYRGDMSPPLTREILRPRAAVGVLPYDPARNAVVLIEQFRVGPYAAGDAYPWLLEIVAGTLEDGEDPEVAAHREAYEEAGLHLQAMLPILGYYTSPGMVSEHVSMFCAKVDSSGAGGLHGAEQEGEDIRALVMSLADAAQALAEGRIRTSPAVIALQWLLLQRDAVLAAWR